MKEQTVPQAHVQQWKKNIVNEISEELSKYNTVAILNLENLPSRQSQLIRRKIKEHAKIIITRKRLFRLAIEKSGKKEFEQLKDYLTGMPALILTNQNAFELFKILKDNMSSAPAKAGQTAPEDIWVKAGPTPFAPGPVIGELGAANIVAGIDGGKVVVKKDSLVVKEGEKVPIAAANILARLDIKPMKIGLNLIVALEKDQLYQRKVLNIDINEYIKNFKTAALDAKKLAIGANILTTETAVIMLKEAHLDAKKLALGAEILCDETKEHLMKKAESHAATLKKKVPKTPIADARSKDEGEEEVKEEKPTKKVEEKKEETKEEVEEKKPEPTEEVKKEEKKDDDQGGGK